jgi:hypothetical protein
MQMFGCGKVRGIGQFCPQPQAKPTHYPESEDCDGHASRFSHFDGCPVDVIYGAVEPA